MLSWSCSPFGRVCDPHHSVLIRLRDPFCATRTLFLNLHNVPVVCRAAYWYLTTLTVATPYFKVSSSTAASRACTVPMRGSPAPALCLQMKYWKQMQSGKRSGYGCQYDGKAPTCSLTGLPIYCTGTKLKRTRRPSQQQKDATSDLKIVSSFTAGKIVRQSETFHLSNSFSFDKIPTLKRFTLGNPPSTSFSTKTTKTHTNGILLSLCR